ncbi:hypothetical protein [Vulcanisaeta souniana]|uniref:Uncharacterized protein n=1 Tax=Vulcanisaeta souniana JCM 11219 TaxID=1293586 RepID=A0A830DYN7_9CREN|nr:hypothetical protein [Vulcanisaeta souniana]BDR91897.1 hypothetical protein Vsou_09900 [Vulcanisaeta souniana JCM 11219]GGI69514.1 hypothetical protein GCM10007112_03130 [Vulcanisaeta souniana JCM 11219]
MEEFTVTRINRDGELRERLRKIANELRELLNDVSVEEVVRLIREDRDSR